MIVKVKMPGKYDLKKASITQALSMWHSSKESTCQHRRYKRQRLDPWVGKTPEEGNGNPFQHSCLEKSMDRGAQQATVHGVAESDMTKQMSMDQCQFNA